VICRIDKIYQKIESENLHVKVYIHENKIIFYILTEIIILAIIVNFTKHLYL